MSTWREKTIAGIRPGEVFVFKRTFTKDDTKVFGEITRDYNPVHYDERFAESKGFNGLICHGLLVGGMVCQMGGQVAWLASGMSFTFIRPVYFGDTITCTVSITDIDGNNRARANATFVNQDGITVMKARLDGLLPDDNDKKLLRRMVAEGDKTNGLHGKV